jgi:succinoglycan biosynthesis protein ExoM
MNFLVCICTYKRNKDLIKCLESIKKVILPINSKIKILVIDNTINNNSYTVVKNLKKKIKYNIFYVNEGQRGIVNARNRCLKEAKKINCDFVSFLDDDCTIHKNWFKNVLKIIKNYNADIVTGPQIYKNNQKNISELFEKKIKKNNSQVNWAASNNVLFKKIIIEKENILFDKKLNKFGIGEDQLFFSILSKLGYKIIWTNTIKVYEKTHFHRNNLNWIANRSFRLGVLGLYLDIKIYGLINGYLTNYLKFFYYLIFAFLSLLNISKKFYLYQFVNLLIRSVGRLLSPFYLSRIKFYQKHKIK